MLVWCRGCQIKATKLQTLKNLNMKTETQKKDQPCTIQNVGHTCNHDIPETIHLSFFTREDMVSICKMLDRNGNGANREKYLVQINKVESFVNTKLYRSNWDWRS